MVGFFARWFKNDVEKERLSRAEERKRLENMDNEELREYLRNIPGQFYTIVKNDFDGRGNPKAIAEEVDKADEPTREKIVARYIDRYGGGDYVVYAYKPVGKIRFASFHVEGDPILPGSPDKKPKDPIEAAVASAIGAIPQADLAKIGPALLQARLGLTPPAPVPPPPPQHQIDPILARKISISQNLEAQGKYAEAAAVLSGGKIENGSDFDRRLRGKMEDKMMDLVVNGVDNHKSEKAEEYEAIGTLIDKAGGVVDKVIKRGVSAMKGDTQDDDEDEEPPCQCAGCGKEVPPDATQCPFCGLKFVEMMDQEPPSPPPRPPPTAPPPIIEPPAPPTSPLAGPPSTEVNAQTPYLPPTLDTSPTPNPPTVVAGDGKGGDPKGKPTVEASAPETPAIPKMTKKEREFFDKLLPMVFVNRIKRHYGMKYQLFFKIAGGFTDATKKETCKPQNAAIFDANELKTKHPKEIPAVLSAAKLGFEGMVGKYKPIIDGMISQYDSLSKELMTLGKSGFMAKYKTVNDQDIKKLREYIKFKGIWDFISQPKSVAWWDLYCPQLVKSLEGDSSPAPVADNPAPQSKEAEPNGPTGTEAESTDKPADSTAPDTDNPAQRSREGEAGGRVQATGRVP
jgi:hypothetical protein